MGGLRDQLLKSGLVDEKQVKKAEKEKRKAGQQSGKPGTDNEEKRRLQQLQAQKAERDRQLNLQLRQEAERKAVLAQVRQLIETHRQPKGEGELAYHFVEAGKVKRLYVSDLVRGKLVCGQLAIVRLDGQYELVPVEIADKIRGRDADSVVLHNEPTKPGESSGGEDPYAAYQVPDDLLW